MKYIKKAQPIPPADTFALQESVQKIILSVRERGDEAIRELNQKFDGVAREKFLVSSEEIKEAFSMVKPGLIEAMIKAKEHIETFALAQKKTLKPLEALEVSPGVWAGHRLIPVDSCGCYVPGGGYPLFSSALMLAVPAKVAGVRRIIAATPTMKGRDQIHPATLVALSLAGVDEIYGLGGAQAIAAMSYGTKEIPPVDLIVGPGNQYVTEAKKQCYGQVGIDFIAGPSEVLVLSDETATPRVVAADLLAQSEHDLLAKGILITTSEDFAQAVEDSLQEILATLPTAKTAQKSWERYGEILVVESIEEGIRLSNAYAPEHLEVIGAFEKETEKLTNYGSLFIGPHSAEVFGDYMTGTNHTLPTLKAARYTGGVFVGTFTKTVTFQTMSREGLLLSGRATMEMAEAEGLYGHREAVRQRLLEEGLLEG